MSETEAKKKKLIEGVVTSRKMNKVSVVTVKTFKLQPLYKKRIARTKKYFVFDEKNESKEGDRVRFHLSRPYSKRTKYKLYEIVKA